MFQPNVWSSSVVDQKVHGMVTYIDKWGGGNGRKKRGWEKDVGRITGGCVGMFTNQHDEE